MADDDFTPEWTDAPPLPGSRRAIAKEGRPDQVRVPGRRYYEQLKRDLGLTDSDFIRKQDGNAALGQVRPCQLDLAVVEQFTAIVGPENVQLDDYHRVQYSHGKLAEELVGLKRGIIHEITDLVLHPRSKDDVRQIVALCHDEHIPLYVYGGGSSVTKGFLPERGGVTIVLSTHLNRVLAVNETNHTCRVEAGCLGPQLEDALNHAPERFHTVHRFTQGHFPQSFEISTVGGWVLTLGSGQASTYYGEPYNLVLAMEMITPAGTIDTSDYVTTATGPRVVDVLKGSEGAYGVLVELTIKIFRYMPQNRRYFSYIFPDFAAAVDAAREICQGQFGLPAVLRISDAVETENAFQMYPQPAAVTWLLERRGFKPGRRCLCMGTVEGEADFTRLVRRKIHRIAGRQGGMTTTAKPSRQWEKDRFESFLIAEAITDYDVVMDTVETPVRWDNLHTIHEHVLAYARTVPHATCMSHMSHFYPYGSNLYFIFAIHGSLDDYTAYRTGLIEAMVRAGGSPSHHHGVGRLMEPWLATFLGVEERAVLAALKRHFDPRNIMSPSHPLSRSEMAATGD